MAETQIAENADATLIDRLGLMPHPEGGASTGRARLQASAAARRGSERAAFTVIDFLLQPLLTSRLASLIGARKAGTTPVRSTDSLAW